MMKPKILHGENRVQSRRVLSQIIHQSKKEGWQISRLSGESTDKSVLLTNVRSQALFSRRHLVVVEDFFTSNKGAKKILKEMPLDNAQLVFWENRALSKAAVSGLERNFEILEFKIPVSVFKFVDSLTPGNSRVALKLLRAAVADETPEFILLMLARQARLLIWAKLEPGTLNLPSWQRSKLLSQTKEWTKEELFAFHTELLNLDRANKKSRLPENLPSSLDLLVASI